MAGLTDHGTHGMAGICAPFNPVLSFSNFNYPLGILPSLALKDMSLRLTGRREHCILNYNYVRHVVISRSCIKNSLSSSVD
jgi:hypothetical protein